MVGTDGIAHGNTQSVGLLTEEEEEEEEEEIQSEAKRCYLLDMNGFG